MARVADSNASDSAEPKGSALQRLYGWCVVIFCVLMIVAVIIVPVILNVDVPWSWKGKGVDVHDHSAPAAPPSAPI